MSGERPFLKKTFSEISENILQNLRSEGVVNDTSVGSVTRTLVEVFSRELAVAYEQVEISYKMGFLDTAQSVALDSIAALAGIKRRKAGHLEGRAVFYSLKPAPEDILIPAGTLVSGKDAPLFETESAVILPKGQVRVLVKIISREAHDSVESLAAGALDTLPSSILGIDGAENEGMLYRRQETESDEMLRERTRRQGVTRSKGTTRSLLEAVRSLGYKTVKVVEYLPEYPGKIDVMVHDTDIDDKALEAIEAVVDEHRSIGTVVKVKTAVEVMINVALEVDISFVPPEPEKNRMIEVIKAAIVDFIDQLDVGETLQGKLLLKTLLDDQNHQGARPFAAGEYALVPLLNKGGTWVEDRDKIQNTGGGYNINNVLINFAERPIPGTLDIRLKMPHFNVLLEVIVHFDKSVNFDEYNPKKEAIRTGITHRFQEEKDKPKFSGKVIPMPIAVQEMEKLAITGVEVHLNFTYLQDGKNIYCTDAGSQVPVKENETVVVEKVTFLYKSGA